MVQDVVDLEEGDREPCSEYKCYLHSVASRNTHVIIRVEAAIIRAQTLFIFPTVFVQRERREVGALSKSELHALGIKLKRQALNQTRWRPRKRIE